MKRQNNQHKIKGQPICDCGYLKPVFEYDDTKFCGLFYDDNHIWFTVQNTSLGVIERMSDIPKMGIDYVLRIKTDFVAPSGEYTSDVWNTWGSIDPNFQTVYLTTDERISEMDSEQIMEIVSINNELVEVVEMENLGSVVFDHIKNLKS